MSNFRSRNFWHGHRNHSGPNHAGERTFRNAHSFKTFFPGSYQNFRPRCAGNTRLCDTTNVTLPNICVNQRTVWADINTNARSARSSSSEDEESDSDSGLIKPRLEVSAEQKHRKNLQKPSFQLQVAKFVDMIVKMAVKKINTEAERVKKSKAPRRKGERKDSTHPEFDYVRQMIGMSLLKETSWTSESDESDSESVKDTGNYAAVLTDDFEAFRQRMFTRSEAEPERRSANEFDEFFAFEDLQEHDSPASKQQVLRELRRPAPFAGYIHPDDYSCLPLLAYLPCFPRAPFPSSCSCITTSKSGPGYESPVSRIGHCTPFKTSCTLSFCHQLATLYYDQFAPTEPLSRGY